MGTVRPKVHNGRSGQSGREELQHPNRTVTGMRPRWSAMPSDRMMTVDEISRRNQARLEVPAAGACDIHMTSYSLA
jgi:hypothetical protein